MYVIVIRIQDMEKSSSTMLTTLIHGSEEPYVELFSSREKAMLYWKDFQKKFGSKADMQFIKLKVILPNELETYLHLFRESNIQHRYDPHQVGSDNQGREKWCWNYFSL